MPDRYSKTSFLTVLTVGFILVIGLYWIQNINYLLFHSLAESFSIVIAGSIFMLVWTARDLVDNHYFVFIGVAYLFVAIIDLLHTLTYSGMEIVPGFGVNLPTQLWILARYIEGLSLLIAPFFIKRRLNAPVQFFTYLFLISLALVSIFIWKMFPVCYVEGIGLTYFKIISEFLISVFLFGSAYYLYLNKEFFEKEVLNLVLLSILVSILSETSFSLYKDPYGFFNLAGHYLKILSFYFIYKAVIVTGIREPSLMLFRKLKQSEDALKTEREKLVTILDSMGDGVYIVNADCTIDYVNPVMRKNFGEVCGKKCYEYLSGGEQPCPWCRKDEISSEYVCRWEYTDAVRDRVYDLLETPLKNPDGTFSRLSIFRDVTEQREAEKRIRESEEKYRLLFENMLNGFAYHQIIVDENNKPVDYVFLQVNRAFERLTGQTRDAVLGKRVTEIFRGIHDDPGSWIKAYGNVALTGQDYYQELFSESLRSWFSVSAYSPKEGYLSVIFEDITERKKAEEILRRDREMLEKMINDRTEELLKAQRDIIHFQRLSDIGKMAAVVAHELRNPLTTISVAVSNVKRKIISGSVDDQVHVIEKKVKESNDIINNLLNFSKIKMPQFKVVSITDVINEAVDPLAEAHREKARFKKDIGALKGLTVKVDPVQICEVLSNITNNAFQAISGEKSIVIVRGHQSDSTIHIDIEDNGIGIAPDMIEEIFNPFFTTKAKGTGLGLAVCKEFVNLHGGRIDVKSVQGEGTTFTIILPINS
ncbi:MAG: MASE3 domain-containing protein [Candidatus Omnitrophota bacterium]